ncbi:MAG: DMT family transporter [Bauldia sp.]
MADLLLLASAAIWGVAFYFQKTAMAHVGPVLFLGMRALVAALVLSVFAWLERRRSGGERGEASLWRIGGLGGVAFLAAALLQQIGIDRGSVINSGFLTSLYVVAVPLLVWLLYGRPPRPAVSAAVAMAFAGAWLLSGGTGGGLSEGDLLVAASALLWAGHVLLVGAAAGFGRPALFTCIQFTVVAGLALPVALATEVVEVDRILAAWDSILYVGVLSSALSFWLMALALRRAPVAEATVLMSTETLFAALVGYTLLGERPSLGGWIGGVLIFAAVLVVQTGAREPRNEGANAAMASDGE